MTVSLFVLSLWYSISYYPTILIHGIGGSATDLLHLQQSLEINGVDVYSLTVGKTKLDSIVWDMERQCATVNTTLSNLNIPSEKINLLGISQGGLLARCYVEKYAHITKPVHSLITYGTPHMGIYYSWIDLSHQLDYWKDPYTYNQYLKSNTFLSYLNNEKPHEHENLYLNNLLSLSHFLMVASTNDQVISPKESAIFEFYNTTLAREKNTLVIIPLNESEVYKNSKKHTYNETIPLGLNLGKLDQQDKLMIVMCPCSHETLKTPACFTMPLSSSSNNQSMLNITLSLL